ncbi:HAD family hydrolase [Nocardioides mangrovicus]|uniref:HAD family hydrolase n=1 Tax=Nocardioides mangrovicus TaxID=2478913 RepID=A0A3L8P2T6_9ACTN|nr:HAD family hydrolase [Nocardioides mangrovicus]RLV48879.1 HAD family hydrolase [Nocardioides mangrovicus]
MSIEAVVFDWGGTLTPWHDIDFEAEAQALARAVVGGGDDAAGLLRAAADTVWGRSRDQQRSATVADLFVEAGLEHDPDLLVHYREFWEPHTLTDPEAAPMFRTLRERGLKVGVLSNTVWPREWHEAFFARDGVLDLIDGAVYTSEVPWTKPAPEAFRAALDAIGVADPARCVFVGDRLFDDVWGAHHAGLRAVHIPHSTIPANQVGHTEGEPDAVAHSLAQIPDLVEQL